LRPFPIYPLYTQAEILSLDKPIADCFLFRLRKSCKKRKKRSHSKAFSTSGNTSGTNGSRSFQGDAAGTHATRPPNRAHSGSHAETGAFQRRVQRACVTAMRSCASLSRGVAALLGCVISWLFLSPHRRASRFWSAASLARRKLSGCSLVTAVRFLNRCSRRSMRETYPSERRSGCRF